MLTKTVDAASGTPVIISLADRFAKADEGMWGAARAIAYREEDALVKLVVPATEDTPKGTLMPVVLFPEPSQVNAGKTLHVEFTSSKLDWEGAPIAGKFKVSNSEGIVLAEAENKISSAGVNDTITVNPTVAIDGGKPAKLGPKLKVHVPEPSKPVHGSFENTDFDDDLIAKMMANMASNGMSLADLGGRG